MEILNICRHTFVGSWLDRHSVVIDLGLNRGEFSEGIYSLFQCSIFGLEANPNVYRTIPDIDGLRAFNLAVSSDSNGVEIYINKDTDASIFFREDSKTQKIKVRSTSFEEFLNSNDIKRVSLLKVDIEGAEILLFDSMGDDVFRNIEQITVEFHDFLDPSLGGDVMRIIKRIEELGFYRKNFSLNNGDVLFVNKRYHELGLLNRFSINLDKYGRGLERMAKRMLSDLV